MGRIRLVIAWGLVGIPLLYGIMQTASRVTALFV